MSDGARIIWVLFGDCRDPITLKPCTKYVQRVREAYLHKKPALEKKGYTLGFGHQPFTSKHAFLYLLGDDSCYGMIWHSHGEKHGWLQDAEGHLIYPSDVKRVSKNLQFAALWGCSVGLASYDWTHALGLRARFPQDGTRRFAAQSIDFVFDDIKLGDFRYKPAPLQYVDVSSPLRSMYYGFPKCVELLP